MRSGVMTDEPLPCSETADSRPESDRKSKAAAAVAPLLRSAFGKDLPLCFEFFDGGALGPREGPGIVRIRSSDELRRLLFALDELGLARVCNGDIDLEGDLFTSLRVLRTAGPPDLHIKVRTLFDLIRAAHRLGALGPSPQRGNDSRDRPRPLGDKGANIAWE